jgi:hypothetical protein
LLPCTDELSARIVIDGADIGCLSLGKVERVGQPARLETTVAARTCKDRERMGGFIETSLGMRGYLPRTTSA